METKKWLEISAEYNETISNLEKLVTPHQTTSNLCSPFVSEDQTKAFIKNQRIRSYLNNCREANRNLGIRKGEKVEEYWLERLTKTERDIFVRFYEQKKETSEIAAELGLTTSKVKIYFNRSMKKVMKHIQGKEL